MQNIDKTGENSSDKKDKKDEQVNQSATAKEVLNDNHNSSSSSSSEEIEENSNGSSNSAENNNGETEGKLREQIGAKNALIIDSLSDDKEKLLNLLKEDKSLRKTAEKKGITIDSLSDELKTTQKTIPPETLIISEKEINENVGENFDSSQREAIQKKAEAIANAGVDIDIAIKTAIEVLGLNTNSSSGRIGAIAGGESTTISSDISGEEWINKTFSEQEEYRKIFGEPKF